MTSGSSDLIAGRSISLVRSGIKYAIIRNAGVQDFNGGEDGREEDEIFGPKSHDEMMSYNEKFPAELREEMLARVASVTHLYHLRLVCKAWYGVIMSANLARLHAARTHDEAWLLVAKPTEMVNLRRRGAAPTTSASPPIPPSHVGGADEEPAPPVLIYYNIVTCPKPSVPDEQQQWIAPSLPFLQADLIQDRYRQLDLSMCKSHGGLVCCILLARRPSAAPHSWARLLYGAPHRAAPKNTILVFNPITRAYKVLPTPPAFDWSVTALHTTDRRTNVNVDQGTSTRSSCLDLLLWRSRSTGQFKVAICNRIAGDVRVFDSRKGLWIPGSSPPGGGGGAAAAGGAHGRTSIRPRFDGFRDSGCREKIYWYDVEKDEWLSATLPAVTGRRVALRRPSVFKAEDVDESVMLAALLQPDGAGGAAAAGPRSVSGFGVWKLAAAAAHVGSNASYCNSMSIDSTSSACRSTASTTWVPISSTPPAIYAGRVLRRLNDSKLICHSQLVCLTGLLRFSPCPWNCFYPRILTFNTIHRTWKWLPQPLGRKTWAKFHVVSLFTPNLECIA